MAARLYVWLPAKRRPLSHPLPNANSGSPFRLGVSIALWVLAWVFIRPLLFTLCVQVRLNVGGDYFVTTQWHMTRCKDSFFDVLAVPLCWMVKGWHHQGPRFDYRILPFPPPRGRSAEWPILILPFWAPLCGRW